jgi:hypothetical protein
MTEGMRRALPQGIPIEQSPSEQFGSNVEVTFESEINSKKTRLGF